MMLKLMLVALGSFLLASCAGGGPLDRKRPDEFAVGRQAPLVIPPDFTLAPPRPGAPRPIGGDSQQQALEALFGPGVRLPPRSEIESRLLEGARATRVDSSIRNLAGEVGGPDATMTVEKGAFLRDLLDAPVGTRNPDMARVSVGG